MADTPSAIPYGTAALGQGLFATSSTAANWAYSAWDATTVSGTAATPAGTSPPTPVIGTGSSPIRGTLTFGTGTNSSTGAQATITFGATLPSTPIIVVSGANQATAAKSPSVIGASTTGFSVGLTAPIDSQAGTAYSVNWVASL